MKECEVALEDCMVPNVEDERRNVFVIECFCNKDEHVNYERHDHT